MFISVIVPAYNAEKWLHECIDSLLNQKYPADRYEIIAVNDGSRDDSGAILDEYARRDPRVRPIHQENQGLGGARNSGIAAAVGEYFAFVDSDDRVTPDFLSAFADAARSVPGHADMVIANFAPLVNNKLLHPQPNYGSEWRNRPLNTEHHPELLLFPPAAWLRLYRRDLFAETGLRFTPRSWFEDLHLIPRLTVLARNIVYIPAVTYHYRRNPESIMNSARLARNVEMIQVLEELLDWFKARREENEFHSELEFLVIFNAFVTSSVRIARQDPHHPLLSDLYAFTERNFPNFRSNSYLKDKRFSSRGFRLSFNLIERRRYGLLRNLFRLRGLFGN
ncbi:MAG: glycosyltransferase family 2 protein [Clostridiaceae bacterium]|nr:glycosyltransferase family 2 protein [Clostridiaceae bacterium]